MSFDRSTVNNNGTPKAVVCKGDRTSHGGVVIEGTSLWKQNGLEAALSGFKVYCPKCKPHIHTITQASSGIPVHGLGILALNGDLTSCGATLIAESASASLMGVAQAFADGKLLFDESFTLKDKDTGEVFPNMPYTAPRYTQVPSPPLQHSQKPGNLGVS